MKHKIIWNDEFGYAGHRGITDPRPSEIDADRSEILYAEGSNAYPIGIRFVKSERAVATFFQLPVGIVIDDV